MICEFYEFLYFDNEEESQCTVLIARLEGDFGYIERDQFNTNQHPNKLNPVYLFSVKFSTLFDWVLLPSQATHFRTFGQENLTNVNDDIPLI